MQNQRGRNNDPFGPLRAMGNSQKSLGTNQSTYGIVSLETIRNIGHYENLNKWINFAEPDFRRKKGKILTAGANENLFIPRPRSTKNIPNNLEDLNRSHYEFQYRRSDQGLNRVRSVDLDVLLGTPDGLAPKNNRGNKDPGMILRSAGNYYQEY